MLIRFPDNDDELVYSSMTMSNLGGVVQCSTKFTDVKEVPRKLGLMINWANEKMMLAGTDFKKVTITRMNNELRMELILGGIPDGK